MRIWIDLNADLGEGCGDDAAIMQVVTSCNIACGGHAGDAGSMQAALALAKQHGVSAGAHPSYPDRENFGRKELDMNADDLRRALVQQVETLKSLATSKGVTLSHLKPHGALYNTAGINAELANLIAQVTAQSLPGAALVGPPESQLQKAAQAQGLRFIGEGFADRAYEQDGSLRSRDLAGAVLEDEDARIRQALQIAQESSVQTFDDHTIKLAASTICLHGDTPGALASARLIRAALEAGGMQVRAPV